MAKLWATHRVRDRATNGSSSWRHVGRQLPEIPTPMDRSVDGDPGGRVPGQR